MGLYVTCCGVMLRFNVSSLPLLFFHGGGSKVNFIILFSWSPRLVLGLCVDLLWLLCFYLHVQCLFVGFNDFLGTVSSGWFSVFIFTPIVWFE